jgi:hypothetical protein
MILGVTVMGWILIAICWWPLVALGAIAWWRRGRFTTSIAKVTFAALTATIAILPAADAMWIQWRFDQLCKGAELHVPRKIIAEGYYDTTAVGAAGFEVDSIDSTHAQQFYDRISSGWRFLEGGVRFDRSGKTVHIEKIDGVWRKRILDKPEARYHFTRQTFHSGYQIGGVKEQIVDTTTGESVGSLTTYYGHSGIVDALWLRFFDPAAIHQCPRGISFSPESVLIPINKK